MLLEGLVTVGLWLYYCYFLDLQPQGRYLLPATLPLMFVLTKGAEGILHMPTLAQKDRLSRGITYGVSIGLVLLLFYYVLHIVLPVFGMV